MYDYPDFQLDYESGVLLERRPANEDECYDCFYYDTQVTCTAGDTRDEKGCMERVVDTNYPPPEDRHKTVYFVWKPMLPRGGQSHRLP